MSTKTGQVQRSTNSTIRTLEGCEQKSHGSTKNVPADRAVFLAAFKARPAADTSGENWPIVTDPFGSPARLSACEREIDLLVCEGHSNAGISRQLGKSVLTVKTELQPIFKKLQLKSRSQLFALAAHASIQVLVLVSCDFLVL